MDFKQFKLTSGEEIVTQVIEWPDEDNLEIVIKNPLKVFSAMAENNSFYHSFRPWMLYQVGSENLMLLNMAQIVGEANPHESVISEYNKTLKYLLGSKEQDLDEMEEYEEEVSMEDIMESFFHKGKLH